MLAVALLTIVAVSYHRRRLTPIPPLATGRTASTRLRSSAEKAPNPPRQNTGSVQIPIAPDAPPSPHLPRFPPLEVCVRRPPGARRATFVGPPSANLHKSGLGGLEMRLPLYPRKQTSSGQVSWSVKCDGLNSPTPAWGRALGESQDHQVLPCFPVFDPPNNPPKNSRSPNLGSFLVFFDVVPATASEGWSG